MVTSIKLAAPIHAPIEDLLDIQSVFNYQTKLLHKSLSPGPLEIYSNTCRLIAFYPFILTPSFSFSIRTLFIATSLDLEARSLALKTSLQQI